MRIQNQLKQNLVMLILLAFLLVACAQKQSSVSVHDEEHESFNVTAGTNIAHWLSQSDRRGLERENFFTRKDVALIDSLGFDHIRLPIDEEQMWDEAGKRNEDAFVLLNNCLNWCEEFDLKVIVDLHILRSHHFNNKEKPLWTDLAEQVKFIALWKDLSSVLHERQVSMVAYEMMNEPVADDHEQWNTLLGQVVDSIRSWEKERVLVIGSNRWQSANTFDKLKVPPNDPNILLSFHFYEPFMLTHYQASWTALKDMERDVQYPGQIVMNGKTPEEQKIFNRDTLVKMMQKPLRVADSLKLPLYCGEFGAIYKAPLAARLAWYKDMVSIFNEYHIGYANWNYKGGSFGIVDAEMKLDTAFVEVLSEGK